MRFYFVFPPRFSKSDIFSIYLNFDEKYFFGYFKSLILKCPNHSRILPHVIGHRKPSGRFNKVMLCIIHSKSPCTRGLSSMLRTFLRTVPMRGSTAENFTKLEYNSHQNRPYSMLTYISALLVNLSNFLKEIIWTKH